MQFAAENEEEKNAMSFLLYSHTKEVIDPSRKRGHQTKTTTRRNTAFPILLSCFGSRKRPFMCVAFEDEECVKGKLLLQI